MSIDAEKTLSDIFSITKEIYNEMSNDSPEADHSNVFEGISRLGAALCEAERASFWKWDKDAHTLWTAAAMGTGRITIPDDAGLVGKALAEKRIIVTNDPYNDPGFEPDIDRITGYETRSLLIMPVSNMNGEFIGAYQAINKFGSDGKFDRTEDCRRLSLAAVICGLALESEVFLDESRHDKLTRLRNRMGFYNDFDRKYSGIIADKDRCVSLFICDIDKFKRINDTYGHNCGDDVLKHTAEILTQCCRSTDNIYRWGGEEFIMLMADADITECAAKAEELRVKIMNSTCHSEGNAIKLTLSFGVVQFDPAQSIEANISAADEKLYAAKEGGRNRVVV